MSAQAWTMEGWVTSWEEGHWGGQELHFFFKRLRLGLCRVEFLVRGALGRGTPEVIMLKLGHCRDG